jgi:hypothetical protein
MGLNVNNKTSFPPISSVPPNGNSSFVPCPELMTEDELIQFLRIPEISNSENYHNVIDNLKRVHGLPRLYLCGKVIYPLEAIKEWVRQNTVFEK